MEVAKAADGTIGIRDSKANTPDTIIELTRSEWAQLLSRLRNMR